MFLKFYHFNRSHFCLFILQILALISAALASIRGLSLLKQRSSSEYLEKPLLRQVAADIVMAISLVRSFQDQFWELSYALAAFSSAIRKPTMSLL